MLYHFSVYKEMELYNSFIGKDESFNLVHSKTLLTFVLIMLMVILLKPTEATEVSLDLCFPFVERRYLQMSVYIMLIILTDSPTVDPYRSQNSLKSMLGLRRSVGFGKNSFLSPK